MPSLGTGDGMKPDVVVATVWWCRHPGSGSSGRNESRNVV